MDSQTIISNIKQLVVNEKANRHDWTIEVVLEDQKHILVNNNILNRILIIPQGYKNYNENRKTTVYFFNTIEELSTILKFVLTHPSMYNEESTDVLDLYTEEYNDEEDYSDYITY